MYVFLKWISFNLKLTLKKDHKIKKSLRHKVSKNIAKNGMREGRVYGICKLNMTVGLISSGLKTNAQQVITTLPFCCECE